MAIETILRKTCDLTGAEGAKTYTFSVGGVDYEIELSDGAYAETLGKLMGVGPRRVGHRSPTGRRTRPAMLSGDKAERAEMRAWLRSKGHDVADRGVVKAELVELWQNRNTVTAAAPAVVTPITTTPRAAKKAAKRAPAAAFRAPAKAVHVPLQGVSRNAAIRAWAAKNNLPVPSKGRIPGHVVDAWKAADSPSIDDLKVG